jgi:hypothetical protein
MSHRLAVVEIRSALALIALGCMLCSLGVSASGQNSCQKDEVFGGYAWLAPNGWAELDYKVNNIPNAFDASNAYYLPNFHNLGVLVDGSGHYKGGTTPPNLLNGSTDSTGVGYALGGLQYKFHNDSLQPFFRGFLGAANISPDCCHGTQWRFAAGGGGGLDLSVKPRFSIRLIQADYIYSSYPHIFPSNHPTEWNSVRLAAGVVFNLGSYCAQAPLSCTASAAPTEVWAGEPVKLTATGVNFAPKHIVTYGWSASGGKISSAATPATEIDTTGMAPGSYTASATITDPKLKKANSATCAATFVVKQPPPPIAPLVRCSADLPTIAVHEAATVTMVASSPDRRPLTYSWSSTGGQLQGHGDNSSVTATEADAGKTITVTGTATDDRSLTASCDIQVKVSAVPPCVAIEDWGQCSFDTNPKKPWRVDNVCKDVLDKLALRLQQTPNGKLEIVGYTGEKEMQNLGGQRSVSVKYYLSKDEQGPRADGARIEPRQGGSQSAVTHFYFVPEGKLCNGQTEQGTTVDENVVKGQPRTVGPKKHAKNSKSSPALAQ